MEKNNIQKILNYYLEYEIYNIANSSQIKVDENNSYIINGNIDIQQAMKELNRIKQNKVISVTEKFIGKKLKDKEKIIKEIMQEIEGLNSEQTNQLQIVTRIKNLIREKAKNIDTKVIENFANQICDIKTTNEFWMYAHNISLTSKNSRRTKKQPLFIFKCQFENEQIKIIDANVNSNTINTVLTILLDKEMADVSIEYEEPITNYSQEIKSSIDSGNIEHIIELFYVKLSEYVDSCLTRENIRKIHQKNSIYNINEEYIISLEELTDDAIKNIKEDIELLKKIIECDGYIPNLLNKYFNGNTNKKNINDNKYEKTHKGNYKSNYGVGQGQYKIVNSINDNDLIAVEGPPGTGKTSLLKEIIANKVVERANLILENWNQSFTATNYNNNTYYKIDWYNKDVETVKSIVVSSKNGEAIENVGEEVNKDIKYMMPISRKYTRTKREKNTVENKEMSQYRGLVCLPLGKQDNVQDFKNFLYQRFLPMLERLQNKTNAETVIEKVKEKYQKKQKEVTEYEQFLLKLSQIKDSNYYFYGIDVAEDGGIEQIENELKKDKKHKENRLEKIKIEVVEINEELKEKERELKSNKQNIKELNNKIENCQKKIIENKTIIKNTEENKTEFNTISRNIFTRLINYKKYNQYKNIDFDKKIIQSNVEIETEEEYIKQYIKEKNEIEKEKDKLSKQYNEIESEYQKLKTEYKEIKAKLKEIKLIEEFNEKNKDKYWSYSSILEIYCKSYLNKLNQDLFQLALKLNEAYIIKNGKEIAENLRLFLPEEQPSYICQKFYDSTDIYNETKQEGIRNLWNTVFLCFPVITTTLDSFCKRCFHLIPEYIDLELIDEAGQILPHNLVSALYRAKKAVIVGDVNQIEPIHNNVNRDFCQNQKAIGAKFEDIKIEENSIQTLANKNTDILSNGENIILNEHYRCEKNIINFSNKNIYENKLNMNVKDNFDKPFLNNMIALDVRGKRTKTEKQNRSKNENKIEVEACIQTIKYIKEQDKNNPSIAIVTPFKEQKFLLESRLKREGLDEIKVGTVHAFQGQEKDYIIFTPTLDMLEQKFAVKFIGNKCNMLNVAVTRAKKQFIYIGNLDIAEQTGNYIAKLIKYIKENGLVYSLYDIDNSALNKNFSERILQILQPELEVANDNIGLYIQQKFDNGIVLDAKQHYDLLMYTLKNTKKEIFIMSPWIRENVINDEFLSEIKRLKESNCKVKIIFGYKNGNRNVSGPEEIVKELTRTKSLGFAKEESVRRIVNELYMLLGKENFIYAPPTHAKVVIVDDKYMFMGSHNWLSNAGKMDEKDRAREGTVITTSKDAINYTKETLFI